MKLCNRYSQRCCQGKKGEEIKIGDDKMKSGVVLGSLEVNQVAQKNQLYEIKRK